MSDVRVRVSYDENRTRSSDRDDRSHPRQSERTGAAARLGVPRTILIAKMQRLGLSKELPKPGTRRSHTARGSSTTSYVPM